MPIHPARRRAVALSVAAALVGVSTVVLFSAAGTPTASAASAPGSTVLASVADEPGEPGYYDADQAELSADGTAVVFTSAAQLDDLPTGYPYPSEAVYVRDLVKGRTVLISRGQFERVPIIGMRGGNLLNLNGRAAARQDDILPGEVAQNHSSYQPSISADGRYVAFVTTSNNIVPSDADYDQDIIVCDRDPDGDGVFDEDKPDGDRDYRYFKVTSPVIDPHGTYREDYPRWPRLSDDAGRIVWQDQSNDYDFQDRVRTAELRTAPTAQPGPPVDIEGVATELPGLVLTSQVSPEISGDGEYVALTATYRHPAEPEEGPGDYAHRAIMRVNLTSGSVARVDLAADGTPISDAAEVFVTDPVLSRDGSVIAFQADRRELGDCEGECWYSDNYPDVHVVGVGQNGVVTRSELVSRDNFGEPVNGMSPGLSADGRFVAFVTDNLFTHDGVDDVEGRTCLYYGGSDEGPGSAEVDRDIRASCQVVVRDLVSDRARVQSGAPRLPGTLASPGTGRACADDLAEDATCGGNDSSTPLGAERGPTLSADGTRVSYSSSATDLVPGLADDGYGDDVFVRTFRPEVLADPDPLDFGEVAIGETATATLRFDHVGMGPLTFSSMETAGGPAFAVTEQSCVGSGFVLNQGETCLVEVAFSPAEEQAHEGAVSLLLSDGRQFTAQLSGTGVTAPDEPDPEPAPARFAAAPDSLDFGERLLRSTGPDRTVTVTNGGETPLTVDGVTVEPVVARASYTVVGDTCSAAPVAPGGSCAVSVRFVPTTSGDLPGVLAFTDDAAGSPHLVGLVGSAPAPTITVSPAVSPPGRVVTVTGLNFAPGQEVQTAVPLAVQTGPVTVAEDGTFRASLLILPKAAIGNRVIVARTSAFPEINAEIQLLVVTPTVGPAEFVGRG